MLVKVEIAFQVIVGGRGKPADTVNDASGMASSSSKLGGRIVSVGVSCMALSFRVVLAHTIRLTMLLVKGLPGIERRFSKNRYSTAGNQRDVFFTVPLV